MGQVYFAVPRSFKGRGFLVAGLVGVGWLTAIALRPPAVGTITRGPWSANVCESAPFVWRDHLYLVYFQADRFLLRDLTTRKRHGAIISSYKYPSAYAERDTVYVWCTRGDNAKGALADGHGASITQFTSRDLRTWQTSTALTEPDCLIYNTSVCKIPTGYLMAYEVNQPRQFHVRFATSPDLETWHKLPARLTGVTYAACPTVRWHDGWFYCFYLDATASIYVTRVTRSRDLVAWHPASRPVLTPAPDEGVNVSDLDFVEHQGRLRLWYSFGDQAKYLNLRSAEYAGSEREFCESFYP